MSKKKQIPKEINQNQAVDLTQIKNPLDLLKAMTPTQKYTVFTSGVTSRKDSRQAVPNLYTVPNREVRRLWAKLLLEETLETITALGFKVIDDENSDDGIKLSTYELDHQPLEDIINGCCDTMYVATGVLTMCGVPDIGHLMEVNQANASKFPDCEAIVDSNGKFLKPEGWQLPNHARIEAFNRANLPHNAFIAYTEILLDQEKKAMEHNKKVQEQKAKETGGTGLIIPGVNGDGRHIESLETEGSSEEPGTPEGEGATV